MRDLLAALSELRERLKEIPQADERRLSDLKTEILGRKAGALTQIIGRLPKLDPSSKKEVGAAANALKRDFEAAFEARERELKRAAGAVTGVDLTMPGRAGWQGGLHLVTQVVDEICDIFRELGFTRAVGPEAETEHYNFFALNFPKDHPALPGVPANRGPGGGRGHHLRRLQGNAGDVRAPVLHLPHAGAIPAVVLPVHRAVGRDGRAVPDLQGRGMPHVQAERLDGDPRLGDGAPRGTRELQSGQRALHRLRVGHGPRAHRHDPPRHSRYPGTVRERRPVPHAVRGRDAMIVSRRWLEALLERTLDARDVAERLTLHVAAVDAVVPLHQDLNDILIARVLEVKKHPDADRLSLCLVDSGGAASIEVVCGAPNVQAGKTYPYAPVGAVLPGGLRLERKKIRGVESNGMLCSAKELGL